MYNCNITRNSLTLDESSVQIEVVVNDRIQLPRTYIQQILQYETTELGRATCTQVGGQVERDKVAHALIAAQCARICQEHLPGLLKGFYEGKGVAASIPIVGECFIEEEWCYIVVIRFLGGAVGEAGIDEDALSVRDGKPDDAREEVGVRLDRVVVAVPVVNGIGLEIEFTALRLGFFDVLVPALEEEVGIVAEVDVLTCNTAIDLKSSMFVQATSRPECVWDTGVSATDGVLTTHQVTTCQEAKG